MFTSENSSKQICWWILMWERGQQAINFYGFVFWPEHALIIFFLQARSFSFHKTLIDGLESCGLLVDYCDVFISSLDSHSDGIHSLQRTKWCNAKFSPIYPNLLHLSTLSKFIFGWNIYLTDSVNCDKGRYFGIEHIFRAAGFWFLVRGRDTLYLSYFPAVPRQLTFYFCQQWAIQVCRAWFTLPSWS